MPIIIFRETPQVTFFDPGVSNANGADIVIHHKNAVSPPNDEIYEQYYVHHHQVDHNLVIQGERTFTLLNLDWDEPHHVIYLNRSMGALQIPEGTFHRSISGSSGSIVLNQAVRDKEFIPQKEFIPVSLRDRTDLQTVKAIEPVVWLWEEGEIKRMQLNQSTKTMQLKKFSIIDHSFN